MNTTNNNSEERTITIADLWRVFLTALPLMIIAAILIVGIGYAYRKLTYRPTYTSEGAFFIMRDRTEAGEGLSTGGETQLAMILMPTCYDVVTSYGVYEETSIRLQQDEQMNYSPGQIASIVSVSTKDDSLIMTLRATASTPATAQKILDKFMTVAEKRVNDSMDNDLVTRFAEPRLPVSPSSRFGTMRILFIGAFAAILVYAVYLILDIIDDRIRTGEDITDVAGMTLLGIVPDANSSERKYAYKYGRKYAKHYGRYGVSNTQKKKED